jgi:O-antigen/teichoic acid export membrane protein
VSLPDRATLAESSTPSANRGAVTVAGGLLVVGVTSYGFLTLSARSLSPADFSAIAGLWFLMYALAGGFFLPLEQETTRAVAQRVLRGERVGPVVGRVAALGAGLLAVMLAVITLLRVPLAEHVLGGRPSLVLPLCLALTGMAGLYVTRGLLAGTSSFFRYAVQLAGEGTLRLVFTVIAVVAVAATVNSIGLAVGLAPLAMLALTFTFLPRPGGAAKAGKWPEVTQNLGLLLVASVVAQGMANAGPIVLQILGVDHTAAGRFSAGFILVRLPLFFTGALQASLLPRLVEAAEIGDQPGFNRTLRQMVLVVAGLGVVALSAFALIGPQVVRLLFGASYVVARADLVVLALSSVMLLLAALLQSAALATSGHRVVAASWAASGVTFVLGCLLPLKPFARIELAYVMASAVVLLLLWLALRRASRAWDASVVLSS